LAWRVLLPLPLLLCPAAVASVALRVYQLAHEQVVGTGDVCTTGVVRGLVCGGWMDEWILVGTHEKKVVSFTVIAWKKITKGKCCSGLG
jgi:hypothetical protein